MTTPTSKPAGSRRAGPLFGAFLLAASLALALTPAVPPIRAIDPTPSPAVDATPPPADPTPAPTPDPTPAPAPDPTPAPTPDPTPAPAPDPTPAPTPDPTPAPAPDPTPAPTPDPGVEPTPAPSAEPSPSPTTDPTPAPTPDPVRATIGLEVSAPADGRRRVDPGSVMDLSLTAIVDTSARALDLVAALPPGWTVVEDGRAVVDRFDGTITWHLDGVEAGAKVEVRAGLRAPVLGPAGQVAFVSRFEARLDHGGETAAIAAAEVLVAPRLVVEHTVFARIGALSRAPMYLPVDAELTSLARFDVFRVRFQVRNADSLDAAVMPRLQVADGSGSWADVPADATDGQPLHLDGEWRRAARGTAPGPDEETIPTTAFLVDGREPLSPSPVAGHRLMEPDRVPRLVIPGGSHTEIEFTVQVSREVTPEDVFRLRLSDDGTAIEGAAAATAVSAAKVGLPLSPGQRNGIPVGPPVDAKPVAVSGVDFPLVVPASIIAAWPESGATPRYRLAVAAPGSREAAGALAAPLDSPHSPDTSLVSDTCGACHRAHAGQNVALLAEEAPQATMCFTCHDGTGSSLDTKAQFENPALPANDPATRSYYRHDATANPAPPSTHVLATDDEFGGVSNRHAVCADCHNAHNATTAPPAQFTDGWSVSGQQAATAGVAVANGPAGAAPTYALKNGTAGNQPTREYEICLKCHSGFTVLPSNAGRPPSEHFLDKGIELNPSNASYHPIEAPGTNLTPQMAWSLSNTSPYKQWNFTTGSTVRCAHCHGDPQRFSATTPPAPDGSLSAHTSQYRGLLLQSYEDRVLNAPGDAYDPTKFALCYVCHAEQPFRSSTATNTAFDDHDLHLSTIAGEGPGGTDIDTPGAGGGNAICAECHFRTHSTAQATNEGDRANPRLVNFAPNVRPYNGVLRFTKTATGGSCTLVCHGQVHDDEGY